MNSQRTTTATDGRIVSVDALRGFDMFWIIGGHKIVPALLVLAFGPLPGWLAYQFEHPKWIGFSAWDIIMPLFLFIVGVAMPFSFAKRLERGDSKKALYAKIIRRTMVLFVLGMVAQGNLLEYDLSRLHVYCNTLQAIACGYLVAAIVMLNLRLRWQMLTTAVFLVGFWLLMVLVPTAGSVAGALEPNDNLAMHIDETILGRFRDGTTYTWILSGLSFAATVLLGVMAGHLLRSKRSPWMKVFWLMAAGGGCLAAGWIWGLWFPIIKHLFTSSMVLWAAGWCYLLLGLFYLTIDVLGFRKWAFPFVVIGMNAIAVYMATHVFDFRQIGDVFVGHLAPYFVDPYGDLLRNVAALTAIWLILFYMVRKRTLIRV